MARSRLNADAVKRGALLLAALALPALTTAADQSCPPEVQSVGHWATGPMSLLREVRSETAQPRTASTPAQSGWVPAAHPAAELSSLEMFERVLRYYPQPDAGTRASIARALTDESKIAAAQTAAPTPTAH